MTVRNVLLLTTPSSPGRFAGVARFARAHGWHLTVADRLTHTLNGWTGDGALVTLRDDENTLRYVRTLRRRHIPVVDLTLARPDISLPRVAGDNAEIGRTAARHFQERLFRHTAWFSTAWSPQHAMRYDAFAETMRQKPERWAWELEALQGKADDWKSLSKWLRRRIAAIPKPAGIFCFDDADASRVEAVALECGMRIPQDLAILGAGDDAPLCESQAVPISSVLHDLEENGYVGASLLERLMNGESPPREITLISPRGIAERQSTDSLAASSEVVRKALEIYAANLANPPSTVALAERLGVSRATLDRAFAADSGLSPARMLSMLRIDEAKRLLRTSSLTASEIAYRLGFCNPAYFSNAFRSRLGCTPGEWRRVNLDPTRK